MCTMGTKQTVNRLMVRLNPLTPNPLSTGPVNPKPQTPGVRVDAADEDVNPALGAAVGQAAVPWVCVGFRV